MSGLMRSQNSLEQHPIKLTIAATIAVTVGGAVELIPILFGPKPAAAVANPGPKPRGPLALAGADLYVKEGCHNCHSQMVRPFRHETMRFGDYSLAGEAQYDRPFQYGSKRTGPDLAREGGKYPDSWHIGHLEDPSKWVKGSVMPRYPWLKTNALDPAAIQANMRTLKAMGHPYSDADIEGAAQALAGKTEMDAMVAYLQSLGTERAAAAAQEGHDASASSPAAGSAR